MDYHVPKQQLFLLNLSDLYIYQSDVATFNARFLVAGTEAELVVGNAMCCIQ